MRKILNKLFLAIPLLFSMSAFATGGISVSTTSLSVEMGSSKTFTISAYNAIGDVLISSSNPDIASISTSEWGTGMVDEGQTKTGTITVTGNSVGTATIKLIIDAATFDGDDLEGQIRTVIVNVIAKTAPAPTPVPIQIPAPDPAAQASPGNSNNNNNVQAKSANNEIEELSADGYELTKLDANNYSLSVGPNVDSINLKATAKDSKARVDGAGKHELQNGVNNIEVIVTSESGIQNKINIKVTKRESYSIDDLDLLLNDFGATDINITIGSNTKLTSADIANIKNSGKKVQLNHYNSKGKLLYSWILDGSKIIEKKEFLTTLSNNSKNTAAINNIMNTSRRLLINTVNNNVPNGTKIRLFVGDKFDSGEVKVFIYNNESSKMDLVQENLIINDGYIEFDINDGLDYIITKDFEIDAADTNAPESEGATLPILFWILIFLLLVLIIAIIIFIITKKKTKKDRGPGSGIGINTSDGDFINGQQ